jgi:protease-4
MSIDNDALIDRRRLKRRIALWRVLAIVALVAAVAAGAGQFGLFDAGRHVATLWIDGFIFNDVYRTEAIYELTDDSDVAALIVHIDSPGGGTYASESLYRALRAVGEHKPVVAVMEGVAASGGYMTAIAADHILARDSTITGSIGVIMEATNFVGLMEMIGVETEAIRSGPLKARPNPFERMTAEARAVTQDLIDEVHDMFVGMVAERRALDPDRTRLLADGRIYTGGLARANGLVDAIGGKREARAWLEDEHGIARSLPERDVEIDRPDRILNRLFLAVFGKPYLSERLTLDGLVSVWHPSATFSN